MVYGKKKVLEQNEIISLIWFYYAHSLTKAKNFQHGIMS